MKRFRSGSPFETEFAYSRAVSRGEWCFVSGTTGYDYDCMEIPDDALAQARNALATIHTALCAQGFSFADVVRARYIVIDHSIPEQIAPALREAFDAHPPAATMIVAGLIDPAMKIEIDVTAYRPRSAT